MTQPRRTGAVSLLAHAVVVVALTVATWLYFGYRWEVWPQPGFLDHVLHYSGLLHNDWHTSLPPVHWAFVHVLALVPPAHLEKAVLVGWVGGLLVLWAGFVWLARLFGLSVLGALAAGLVVIPTALGGVGVSETIFGYLYPTGPAFALAVVGLAALVARRPAIAGAFLGLACIVHPNVGVLSAAVIAPAVLLLPGDRKRNIVRLAVPLAVLAVPFLLIAALQQAGGAELSAQQRYDLLVIARQPHHMLFSTFPASEYLRTGLWLGVGVLGGTLVWKLLAARVAAVVAVLVLIALALGAAAGEAESPFLIVQLQTSRLSPFLVLLGVLAGAAALTRFAPRWAPAVLALIALVATPLTERIVDELEVHATDLATWVGASAVEAGCLAVAIGVAVLFARRAPSVAARLAPAVIVLAVLAVGWDMIQRHDERVGPRSPQEIAWQDVALHTRIATHDGDLVVTPPDLDGFRTFSHRPVIVEFGTFRYGEGDAEWLRRMNDMTGDPGALDRSLGTDVSARVARLAASYDHNIATTPAPACRYGAHWVVARSTVAPPRWLEPTYNNGTYQLLRLRPGACG